MIDCPYKPKHHQCSLEIDYMILQEMLKEAEDAFYQLLEENHDLWDRLNKAQELLASRDINFEDN